MPSPAEPSGPIHMDARGINDSGYLVGNVTTSPTEAWLWRLSSQGDISLGLGNQLGGEPSDGQAINNDTPYPTLVGGYLFENTTPVWSAYRGFKMTIDLSSFPFDTLAPTQCNAMFPEDCRSEALGIGDTGLTIGVSSDESFCGTCHNCNVLDTQTGSAWGTSVAANLESLNPGSASKTVAYDANISENIVGSSYKTVGQQCRERGTFWDSLTATPIELPTLPNASNDDMRAYAIADPFDDDELYVVGRSDETNAAVLWRYADSQWEAFDLNDLIACDHGEEWIRLTHAYDINNNGWIVGEGLRHIEAIDENEKEIEWLSIRRAFLLIPASYCAGDLNGDFVVDVLDLLILLAAWGPSGGCADLNDTGAVDVQDLLILLANWGPCPGFDTAVLSLSDLLTEAGITQQQFNEFLEVMMNGSDRQKARWSCYFKNRVMQCVNCPQCVGTDPFAN
ncbi:MAG TPA: hypothetical protein PK400_07935 [Phycisphaerales bacterium]|nr:hypothetical protein [Phycisphaerales bacterium]